MPETATPSSPPGPFADVIGHDDVKDALARIVGSGRLHHAWLFAGREGVGKSRVAKRLAQVLVCEKSAPGEGVDALVVCGACRHCRRIEAGVHPDVHDIAPDGQNIRIAQVRELQQKVAFKPFEARYRVVIMHEADALRLEGANALLKTLEEPTEQTLFVLVTDQPHRLLPTIISRCQPVRFAPFDAEAIVDFLVDRDVDRDRAERIAVVAQGSFGRAIELADTDIEGHFEVLARLDELTLRDPAGVLSLADQIARDKDALPIRLALLQTYYRDLVLLRTGADSSRVSLRWRREELQRRAEKMSLDVLHDALDALSDIEDALERNVHRTLAVERLLFRLTEGRQSFGAPGSG